MNNNFADRLLRAVNERNAPACVGLDPLIERLPPDLLKSCGIDADFQPHLRTPANAGMAADAILAYGREVIRTIAPHIPVVKINIAFFERYYAPGIRTYFDLVKEAAGAGMIVIGDVKRADIGHSTTQYALAQLGTVADPTLNEIVTPDAVTLNPYFGFDAIRPFVDLARDSGGGLFVLVQTSNESAAEVQGLTLSDGGTLCEKVAQIVESWAADESLVGDGGYSCIGAVVSPRDLPSTDRIRTLMPHCVFLVPGFGAQGRTKEEVARCFKADGTGAIVTASRSVIYAYQQPEWREKFGDDWIACVRHACEQLVCDVREATGR